MSFWIAPMQPSLLRLSGVNFPSGLSRWLNASPPNDYGDCRIIWRLPVKWPRHSSIAKRRYMPLVKMGPRTSWAFSVNMFLTIPSLNTWTQPPISQGEPIRGSQDQTRKWGNLGTTHVKYSLLFHKKTLVDIHQNFISRWAWDDRFHD